MNSRALHLLLITGALALLAQAAGAQQCTAGDPCGIGDTLSQGGVNGNTGAGNPIDVTSGNKYQVAVDFPGAEALSLSFRRHYNSGGTGVRTLGPGWSHGYDTRLQRAERRGAPDASTIRIAQGDGRELHFVPEGPARDGVRRYVSRPAGYGIIEENAADVNALRQQRANTLGVAADPALSRPWTWRWLDGRRVTFDGHGRPRLAQDPDGARLELDYGRAGRLERLRDGTGAALRFEYWEGAERLDVFGSRGAPKLTGPKGALRALVLPAGQQIRYGYDAAGLLSEVRLPDGTATRYEYATHAGRARLTRITGPDGSLLGEYDYDAQGRAIRTRDADGEPLRVEYAQLANGAHETRVRDAAGNATRYLWTPAIGGEARVLQSSGAGCRGCAAANYRYTYGADGRISTRTALDARGNPGVGEEYGYDSRGRLLTVHARATDGERRLLRQFEYTADHDFPVRVRRPSVARGLQSMLALEYSRGAAGNLLLTKITESGYAPHPEHALRLIARQTRYEYETRDGRSILKRIDGPFANGATGAATPAAAAFALPAADAARGARDAWSRPTHYRGLALAWGHAGSIAQNEIVGAASASRAVTRLLDDFGRVVAIRNPGQGWQVSEHDDADRLVRIVDARGATTTLTYDAEGRTATLRRAGAAPADDETVTFEWSGARLAATRVVDADGERSDRYTWDARGALAKHEQRIVLAGRALELTQEFEWSDEGALRATTLPSGERAEYRLPSDVEEPRLMTASLLGNWSRSSEAALEFSVPVQRAFYVAAGTAAAATPGVDPEIDDALARRFAAGAKAIDAAALDAAGLPRELQTPRGRFALTWDAAARLREVRDAATGARVARYYYDARGRRVAKQVRDARGRERTQFFFYDGTRLVAVAGDGGKVSDEFVYNGLTPVAWRRFERAPANGLMAYFTDWGTRHSELFALETDERGAVSRVVAAGEGGSVVHALRLDTFGETPRGYVAGDLDPRLRLVGQFADDETGLYYHVARFYDPAARRFISPDPAGVADSFGFDATLQLDTTLFAGARPDVFIDPDGAARITYYAVLDRTGTGANARLTVNNQGFNTARWAFVIEDVQPGGDASTPLGQLRAQYAGNGTSLLFERGGNFINANRGGTLSADGRSLSWTGASNIVTDFLNHYGNTRQLVSVPAFTIDNVDDDNATRLIQFLTQTAVQRAACTDDPAPWMPAIPFATEEQSITPATNDPQARKQRLLACGAGATATTPAALEQRRIRRYEAAAEINETARIGKPCADGCPGIKYYCTAIRCVARSVAPGAGTPYYVPSYGRSQFTLATLVSELINNWNSFTAADRQFLGLGAVTLADLQAAQTRGQNAGTHFDGTTAVTATGANAQAWQQMTPAQQQAWLQANNPLTEADYENYLEAGGTWDALSAQARQTFTTNTGLGEREYEDMVRMRTVPIRNSNGLNLTNDARAAIVTQAIYSNATLQTALHGIFTNYDRFTVMAEKLMEANLSMVLGQYPNGTEQETAARVARAHNGGNWQRTLAQLTTNDFANYVKRFIGHTGYRAEGYVSSLRCVEDFGTRVDNVVRPAPNVTSTNGVGVLGVEVALLRLR